MLSATALLIGNGLALLLIVTRMPPFALASVDQQLFQTLLVLHVDLSIYVWLLSAICLVSVMVRPGRVLWLEWSAWGGCVIGLLLMLMALGSAPQPVINNYLPVLDSSSFLLGLALFMAGVVLRIFSGLLVPGAVEGSAGVGPGLKAAVLGSMVAVPLAVLVVVLSGLQLQGVDSTLLFYERLFWGGGHVIQFAYLFLMVAAWIWLLRVEVPSLQRRGIAWLQVLAFLPVLAGVAYPLLYAPLSADYQQGFTQLMRYGSWPLALVVAGVIIGSRRYRARTGGSGPMLPQHFVVHSIVLFVAGIFMGAMIRGDNLLVPAHYHAMTGAVNLAMMGLIFQLFPRWGGETPRGGILAWQCRLYSGGLLMLVSGLAWAGWLGVSRKVAGVEQGLSSLADHLSMGLMGIGGLVSLLGSFVFLVLVFGTLFKAERGGAVEPAEVVS